MIELSRALARRYRAVLRQALAAPRGDAPRVLYRAGPDGLTLEARRDDVAVRYHEEGPRDPNAVAFRASVLTEFEGRTDEPVSVEQVKFGKGRARWNDGVLRVIEFETVTPDSAPPFPDVPKRFTAQPVEMLQALDEAARTTAREGGPIFADTSATAGPEWRGGGHGRPPTARAVWLLFPLAGRPARAAGAGLRQPRVGGAGSAGRRRSHGQPITQSRAWLPQGRDGAVEPG